MKRRLPLPWIVVFVVVMLWAVAVALLPKAQ